MIKSKALKDFEARPERWYTSVLEKVESLWHDLTWNVGRPFRIMKKLYEWHKNVFHRDFDFDSHSMYRLLQYKLQRLEPVLKNGHAIQEDKDMKALALAIKLLGKLDADEYDMRVYDRHEKRYGKLHTWTTPTDSTKQFFTMHAHHENLLPEHKERAWEEKMADYESVSKMKDRHKRWLYAILAKYSEAWWD